MIVFDYASGKAALRNVFIGRNGMANFGKNWFSYEGQNLRLDRPWRSLLIVRGLSFVFGTPYISFWMGRGWMWPPTSKPFLSFILYISFIYFILLCICISAKLFALRFLADVHFLPLTTVPILILQFSCYLWGKVRILVRWKGLRLACRHKMRSEKPQMTSVYHDNYIHLTCILPLLRIQIHYYHIF